MRSLLKSHATLALGSLALLSLFVDASAEPKDEVVAATSTWARALDEDDAVLWGTLSPTVRSDRSALRDYFVTAFKVLPGLKVVFGDQLIRCTAMRRSIPVTTRFPMSRMARRRACPRATASPTSRTASVG